MQKKLKINENAFFYVEDAEEKLNYEDEVILSVFINEKQYLIRQDSYIYEIGYILKHFSDSTKFAETTADDLGYEYFLYQNDFERAAETETICSRDLHEFDYWVGFASDVAVLFYKKADKIYCQITQNNWEKGEYKNLCLAEITLKILEEWKQILD